MLEHRRILISIVESKFDVVFKTYYFLKKWLTQTLAIEVSYMAVFYGEDSTLTEQGQLANDATSSMYDHYLRSFLSINHFSAFSIGWDGDSIRNALFSAILTKVWRTDRPTDLPTDQRMDRPSYWDTRSHLKILETRIEILEARIQKKSLRILASCDA